MKITKRQLRRIIKEASRVRWQSGDVVDEAGAGGYYDAINQLVHDVWGERGIDLTAPDGMQEVEYVKQALKNLLADLETGRF
jgi:hypothetical protein